MKFKVGPCGCAGSYGPDVCFWGLGVVRESGCLPTGPSKSEMLAVADAGGHTECCCVLGVSGPSPSRVERNTRILTLQSSELPWNRQRPGNILFSGRLSTGAYILRYGISSRSMVGGFRGRVVGLRGRLRCSLPWYCDDSVLLHEKVRDFHGRH